RRLETNESSNGTEVVRKEYYFNNWMTLLSQLSSWLTVLQLCVFQDIGAIRIAGSLVFILLLFILTAVLVKVPMEEDCFFSVTMATIWFINSFGAVLQGSLFGLVGMLPQKYSSIFMSGQGLAGHSLHRHANSKTDHETAALGYFITPCVGTLLTLFSYLVLPRLVSQLSSQHNCITHNPSDLTYTNSPHISLYADEPGSKASVIEVFKKIWVMAFCVTFVFTVTLSVFPAITVDVKTTSEGENWELFYFGVLLPHFNINDWLGRTITTKIRWVVRLFPVLVISRVGFIPLLMFCNVQSRNYLPVLFEHDAAFSVIMVFFSLSSGYFVCLSMSYAPQLVEPKDAETAGALMTFFLALGLSIGAALSFPLRKLI
uniref:Solute carrier family 29 member 2 n=1 Tax=Maylandia zebra TaxID=106582 RepID=A0A3P9BPM9_9CICH